MGMQVLKSPQGTEGWDGGQDERGNGGGGLYDLPPCAPSLCTQLPSIPGGKGPVERHRDQRLHPLLFYTFILYTQLHTFSLQLPPQFFTFGCEENTGVI